jgi:glyoxylase-like metal-dependent hydrolase (beta-lactamase superfamily II)
MQAMTERLIFIERDWLSSNMVLTADDDGGCTLIDSGYVKHAGIAVALLREALPRLGHNSLTRLLNTHLHSDHCGGNAAMVQAFGCEVRVPIASAEDVARWDVQALSHAATAQRCDPFVADGVIAPGQILDLGGERWEVLAAPGHDPKSLMFFAAQSGQLISADVLWQTGFGVIFPELEDESGFAEQQAMLDLIERLPVRKVLPGHGPAFSDVAGSLALARKRLQALRADPQRNRRHALKVLIKFMMLDAERLLRAQLLEKVSSATLMVRMAARLGMDIDQALTWALSELCAQGALRREGDWVYDH